METPQNKPSLLQDVFGWDKVEKVCLIPEGPRIDFFGINKNFLLDWFQRWQAECFRKISRAVEKSRWGLVCCYEVLMRSKAQRRRLSDFPDRKELGSCMKVIDARPT